MTSSNWIYGEEMLTFMQEKYKAEGRTVALKLSKKGAVNYQTEKGRWVPCCIHGSQSSICHKEGCEKGSKCGCKGKRGGLIDRNRCKIHGGASLCEHGKPKDFCKTPPCFGNQICPNCTGQKSKCKCGNGGHICDCGCGKRRSLCTGAIAKKEVGELPPRVTKKFLVESKLLFENDEEKNAYYDSIALQDIYDNSRRDFETGCLIYDARKGDARGRVLAKSIADGETAAYRIVYRIEVGDFEDCDWVEHTCDNVACVEKSHLKLKKRNDDGPEYFSRRFSEIFACGVRQGDCLLWKQCIHPTGYGHVKINGETWLIHRAAYQFANDVSFIPAGLQVCHKHSGNRNCFEPSHLYLGTPEQNGQDRVEHGTSSAGEKSSFALITDETAVQIFKLRGNPSLSMGDVAAEFGVQTQLIERIWYRGAYYTATGQHEARAAERQREREIRKLRYEVNSVFTPEQYDDAFTRIMAGVVVDESRGCWNVQDRHGSTYPLISIGSRMRFCHRIIFECVKNEKKPLEKGLLVLHCCEEKGYSHYRCVNPDHLRSGTAKENAIDHVMADKDNVKVVKKIKRDTERGMTAQEASKKYKKSQSAIYGIVNKVYYGYLSPAEDSCNDEDNNEKDNQ